MSLGEYIPNSNTKLLLHLNGNSTDSSGNGNNGTDTNITYGLGYGKFGQSIVKELKVFGQNYVILEHNLKFYQIGKDNNEPIIFGNAAQKHILNSVNITKASAVIVAVNNPESLHLICEAVGELTHNSKTIVTVTDEAEKRSLKGLKIGHIIVETNQIARAVVDEILYCRLDNH